MTTTTKLGDYLGRALVNDNPGTSNATDFLGRACTASDKDYNGQSLANNPQFPPPNRANNTAYTLGTRIKVAGTDEVQTLTVTATGGNYKLSVTLNGETQTTANIAFNANAAAITAAIVALPNVAPGEIVVTGGASPYTITIQSERGNVAQIAVVAGSPDVTGGTVTTGTTTQGATGGQFYEVTTAGTTGGSVPTLPGSVGGTVTDGTAVLTRKS